MQDINVPALVLNTYAQALLIARSKGILGEDARYLALKATSGSITKKVGYPVDIKEVERIVESLGTVEAA